MAFVEAERTRLWLRCAIYGPSGSGKTMTALRMAKGIADKTGCRYAVIDSEARSASKYAGRFSFVVDNLENKNIEGYIAAMNEACRAGYQVLVIDSLSHAWRELTEEVDRITQASVSKNSLLSWGKAGPKQKRLVEAILNFPGHIIATMRSKTEWVIGEGKNGKSAPQKIGLAPEQGKGIEYEFDLLMELTQTHQAVVTKDRTGKFQDEVIDKPGEDFGVILWDWLSGGSAGAPSLYPPANAGGTEGAYTKPELPQLQRDAVPAVTREGTQTPPNAKPSGLKTRGEGVMKEIGAILNTAAPDGQLYFSEDEKADARQIVGSVKAGEAGLRELQGFRDFLADELAKREKARNAA
ncbi:MAG: ATP-binding protein [Treponema sp.]|nr:ATP-binding protein [Treponema sp.]